METECNSNIEHALTVLEYYKGDLKKAAKFLAVPASTLQQWQKQRLREETAEWLLGIMAARPFPSAELVGSEAIAFEAAHTLTQWIRDTFLDERSKLFNKEHNHLREASIGCLWTNSEQKRQGHHLLGQAEMPGTGGSSWTSARMAFGLRQILGFIPDFLLTFDGVAMAEKPNADFCAIVEHELYHCGQAFDQWDCPKFTEMGEFVWCLRKHDIEQFVGVVRRYGAGAAYVQDMIDAALMEPEIAAADISAACGTCRR